MTAAANLSFFIEPLSPLVLRSGRPFGSTGQTGAVAGPTTPLPGSMAGTFRAAWCEVARYRPLDQDPALDRLHLHGPLQMTMRDGIRTDLTPVPQFWLSAPANARARGNDKATALWPQAASNGSGCDLPDGLLPVLPVDRPGDAPAKLTDALQRLWNLEAVVGWLLAGPNAAKARPPWSTPGMSLSPPRTAEIAHIRTSDDRRAVQHAFFVNVDCDYTLPAAEAEQFGARGLWLRAEAPALTPKQRAQKDKYPERMAWAEPQELLAPFDQVAGQAWRLGADGAAAEVRRVEVGAALQTALQPLAAGLEGLDVGDTLCLMLATPGCFDRNGWYPWLLRDDLQPGEGQVRAKAEAQSMPEGRLIGWPPGWWFRLRAALVGPPLAQGSFKVAGLREQPLTLRGQTRPAGPTAAANPHTAGLGRLQWLAPAGSLYWFEVLRKGEAPNLDALQLRPCTRSQYARDGHALALYARAPKPLPPVAPTPRN